MTAQLQHPHWPVIRQLAERYATRRLLTFDERAFRSVPPLQGGSFTILPADQPA